MLFKCTYHINGPWKMAKSPFLPVWSSAWLLSNPRQWKCHPFLVWQIRSARFAIAGLITTPHIPTATILMIS
jgi:hypothetical protein